jgi:hypothetical protein
MFMHAEWKIELNTFNRTVCSRNQMKRVPGVSAELYESSLILIIPTPL